MPTTALNDEVRSVFRSRRRFLLVASFIALAANFAMPLIAGLSTALDGEAVGPLPWAAIYGFGQIALFLFFANLYAVRSRAWSARIEAAVAVHAPAKQKVAA